MTREELLKDIEEHPDNLAVALNDTAAAIYNLASANFVADQKKAELYTVKFLELQEANSKAPTIKAIEAAIAEDKVYKDLELGLIDLTHKLEIVKIKEKVELAKGASLKLLVRLIEADSILIEKGAR